MDLTWVHMKTLKKKVHKLFQPVAKSINTKGGLRMTTKVGILDVVVEKCIYLIQVTSEIDFPNSSLHSYQN